MANIMSKGRAAEVRADGPLLGLPGNAGGDYTLADTASGQVVHSPALPVNQAATGHFVVPFNARLVGGVMRTITQQTSSAGSVAIAKNGTTIGTLTVTTAAPAGTLTSVTIGATGTISEANALLNRGDVLTFSRPNDGASGVVALGLMLLPRA
jgi:hypothetical protein